MYIQSNQNPKEQTLGKPVIFDYFDFRKFLKETQQYHKKDDRKFTHRHIIEYVGASSSGWFSDVINGRITLTPMFRFKLSELFSLSTLEDDYFSNLVNYEQAASYEEKKIFYERISRSKSTESKLILQHQFDFYRIWYISAIRELLLLSTFTDKDHKIIGNLLHPSISSEEVQFAIQVLLEHKLVKLTQDGYKPTSNTIKKEVSFSTFYWKTYMESFMGLSRKALDYPKESRDISAITVSLTETSYIEAISLIAELRKKILKLEECNTPHQKIYQCNIQLFPLSKEV